MLSALDAMHARHCTRAFESAPVPPDVIRRLVEAAGRAPSSKNTQPWRLYLVQGAKLAALQRDLLAAFDAKQPPNHDYTYSPEPLPEPFISRARAVGYGIFQHKGIARDDYPARRAHDRENFEFFGAPHIFLLGTQASAYSHGTFLDCGFVLDNLMLGLVSLGYGSCPQYSLVAYPDLLRQHLPNAADTLFIAGLSFGRPKAGSHINTFQPDRLPVDEWFTTVG